MASTKIIPKDTTRAEAYELWMNAPQPMVTILKTFDVTRMWRRAKRCGFKFNMMMCWAIGRAASKVEEFFTLPVGKDLMKFDSLAVNVIVVNAKGGLTTCDVPFCDNIEKFNADYLSLTERCRTACENHDISGEAMVIGTSALVECDIDGAVGMFAGIYCNPFTFWGKVRKNFFRRTLPFSFQFHHTQMDGLHAAKFLNLLQETIRNEE